MSNPHPHCQIYASDFVFNVFNKELEAMREHANTKGSNIFSDIIHAEQKDEMRIIAENKGAIAFIPFFARFAYETYIFPKQAHTTLISMSDDELYDLAEVFQTVTKKFDANFKSSFPIYLLLRRRRWMMAITRVIICILLFARHSGSPACRNFWRALKRGPILLWPIPCPKKKLPNFVRLYYE